ncbi:MAG TPA: MBL fold metallo-hydrolase [Galbitalea sp.]|jgi:L-ascorbate metabolism protein UlaG (beta-lactamase superfamily)|nr:MBL fold metallo-hydrolase [Galbitalea sp.]
MRITKYEHACFVASIGDKKLVVDPGSFTVPLPDTNNVVAVVVTHEHADHWTPEHLQRILDNSPDVKFFAPAGVAAAATDFEFTVVKDGEKITIDPFELEFFGEHHAIIHSSFPVVDNVGVLINGTVFYPGDSFTQGPPSVDLLAVPASAPWLKIGEVMDYVLAAKPKRSFPVHEMINSVIGNGMANARIQSTTEQGGGEFVPLAPGESIEV